MLLVYKCYYSAHQRRYLNDEVKRRGLTTKPNVYTDETICIFSLAVRVHTGPYYYTITTFSTSLCDRYWIYTEVLPNISGGKLLLLTIDDAFFPIGTAMGKWSLELDGRGLSRGLAGLCPLGAQGYCDEDEHGMGDCLPPAPSSRNDANLGEWRGDCCPPTVTLLSAAVEAETDPLCVTTTPPHPCCCWLLLFAADFGEHLPLPVLRGEDDPRGLSSPPADRLAVLAVLPPQVPAAFRRLRVRRSFSRRYSK